MRRTRNLLSIGVMAAMALLLVAPAAQASVPQEERVPVNDAGLKAAMGFAPEDDVYLWNRGHFHGKYAAYLGAPDTRDLEAMPDRLAPGRALAYYPITGRQFQPRSEGFIRGSSGWGRLTCEPGSTEYFADAQLIAPNGTDLDYVDIWGYDACGEDFEFFLFEYCLPDFGEGWESGGTAIGSVSSAGFGGIFWTYLYVPGDFLYDNRSCTYQVRARFGDFPSTNCACSGNLMLQKIRGECTHSDSGPVMVASPPF